MATGALPGGFAMQPSSLLLLVLPAAALLLLAYSISFALKSIGCKVGLTLGPGDGRQKPRQRLETRRKGAYRKVQVGDDADLD